MGETVKMPFEGKNCRKVANGQDIDYSEEKNGHRSSSAFFSSPEPLGSQGELIGWP